MATLNKNSGCRLWTHHQGLRVGKGWYRSPKTGKEKNTTMDLFGPDSLKPAVMMTSVEAAGSSTTGDMVWDPGGLGAAKVSSARPSPLSSSSGKERSKESLSGERNNSLTFQQGDWRDGVGEAISSGSDVTDRSSAGVGTKGELERELAVSTTTA